MIELDVKPLSDLLILDVKKLDEVNVSKLAQLFDKLEAEARRIGGADTKENAMRLFDSVIKEIDHMVAHALGASEVIAERLRTLVMAMMERRLARTGEARREALRGRGEELIIEKPKKGTTGRESS